MWPNLFTTFFEKNAGKTCVCQIFFVPLHRQTKTNKNYGSQKV